ncbi:transient receptor potential cation channel subfamily M member-like 2 isoform X3 [Dreissena polymorpha]|uniref:transient receptor potential cation channel subfamily M member-like 2 isoform X3 n=1 Tax=Dreissena polymorpha TaxID=45954 RepID=UPI00226461EE|nr:transient receptor potential cation channel subfamily M member-like 2 isoform X3 [Dreissena polymorpha]
MYSYKRSLTAKQGHYYAQNTNCKMDISKPCSVAKNKGHRKESEGAKDDVDDKNLSGQNTEECDALERNYGMMERDEDEEDCEDEADSHDYGLMQDFAYTRQVMFVQNCTDPYSQTCTDPYSQNCTDPYSQNCTDPYPQPLPYSDEDEPVDEKQYDDDDDDVTNRGGDPNELFDRPAAVPESYDDVDNDVVDSSLLLQGSTDTINKSYDIEALKALMQHNSDLIAEQEARVDSIKERSLVGDFTDAQKILYPRVALRSPISSSMDMTISSKKDISAEQEQPIEEVIVPSKNKPVMLNQVNYNPSSNKSTTKETSESVNSEVWSVDAEMESCVDGFQKHVKFHNQDITNSNESCNEGKLSTQDKCGSVLAEMKNSNKSKELRYERSLSHQHKFSNVMAEMKKLHSVEYDEETSWIRKHIKMRECSYLIPENEKGNQCMCDYKHIEHNESAKNKPVGADMKWDYKRHSKQKMTNAFGEIEFVGYGGNIGKYIRVDVDTKMNHMLELMMNVWGLDKPNLLISVTGGAKNFQMNKRLRDTFRRGLMKTALTTGAWIVTGGTHAGVMKHVGEAVKDFGIASTSKNPIIAIGIAPWGCIQNRESLIEEKSEGLWPANYRIEKEQKFKESFLDPNHSHFILVDNATQHKFAMEIPFRAKLEKEIAQIKTETGENAVSVPIVLLVLEGGPGTLETVHQAIQNNTPSVIVKGSNRAADILAYAYLNAKEEEIEVKDQVGKKQKKMRRYMEDSVELTVREMVEREFGSNKIAIHLDWIKECLEKCDLISVFDLDSKTGVKEIDVIMLQALLKANKNQVMDQLRLALAWNRIDVAKSDIFTDDKQWPTGRLDDVMFSAIQLNRVDFIELFLDHGVSLKEFLTKKRLLQLYNRIPNNCLLRSLLTKIKNRDAPKRKNFSLLDVGLLIQSLMGDTFHPNYLTNKAYSFLDVDYILDDEAPPKTAKTGLKDIATVMLNPARSPDHTDGKLKKSDEKPLPDFEQPFQDLFIWSILMIQQDMAKTFWVEGKDAIAAALVGYNLLKMLKNKTDDTELVITIQGCLDEWSELAVGVLSECHTTDEHKAQDLLVRELSNWGDTTCMLIAVKADNKEFISQTACQSLLNSIWHGRLAQENSIYRLLICMFCPFLIVPLLKFNVHMDLSSNPDHPQALGQGSLGRNGGTKLEPSQRPPSALKGQKQQPKLNKMESRSSMKSEHTVQNKPNTHEILPRQKLYYFFTAPVIIFMYNVLSYIVFLSLYTYILIFNFTPTVSAAEMVLIVWVFTIFMEEVRQVVTSSSTTLFSKLQSYTTDTWNIVDIITIGLFIIGIILRFLPFKNTFETARVFLALNFISFFLRLLHIFSVHKRLGPKLVMIGKMVQDLMYFLVILMVFIVSYAIASHSILYPNSPLSWSTVSQVIRKSYWNIYGELFLDEIEGDPNCSFDEILWSNGTSPRCPSDVGKVVVPILMGVYMMFANVLLLNLLIAMFSYTFQSVQDNTDKHWCFQRYSLIYEYYTRPVLCPPLILFVHIILLFKYIATLLCCKTLQNQKADNDFRRKFKHERELVQWENVIADAYHQKREKKEFQSMEFKVSSSNETLKALINRIDDLTEQQHQFGQLSLTTGPAEVRDLVTPLSPRSVEVKLPPKLDSRLAGLEHQIQWIVETLKKNSPGANNLPPTPEELREKVFTGSQQKEKRRQERKAQEDKQRIEKLFEEQFRTHFRARMSPYLASDVVRFSVPDDKVPWGTSYPEYSPSVYTALEVLRRPTWADPDIMRKKSQDRSSTISMFNKDDTVFNVCRRSFMGEYQVVDGLPLNPKGRTGLQGRGLLGRWGPNLAGDPLVSRWKMDEGGNRVVQEGKPVLEFVAVLRTDNQQWALPGAILCDPNISPIDHLKAEFTEEALGTLEHGKSERHLHKKLKRLWTKGVKIYEGYADDQRNTDNAWLETQVFIYHDHDGNLLKHLHLRAGESVELASWLTVSSKISMHGMHLYFLKLAAKHLDAYF